MKRRSMTGDLSTMILEKLEDWLSINPANRKVILQMHGNNMKIILQDKISGEFRDSDNPIPTYTRDTFWAHSDGEWFGNLIKIMDRRN